MSQSLIFVHLVHVVQVLLHHQVKVFVNALVPLDCKVTPIIMAANLSVSSTLTAPEILPAPITNVLTPVLEPVVSMPPVLSSTTFQHVSVNRDLLEMLLRSVLKVSMIKIDDFWKI